MSGNLVARFRYILQLLLTVRKVFANKGKTPSQTQLFSNKNWGFSLSRKVWAFFWVLASWIISTWCTNDRRTLRKLPTPTASTLFNLRNYLFPNNFLQMALTIHFRKISKKFLICPLKNITFTFLPCVKFSWNKFLYSSKNLYKFFVTIQTWSCKVSFIRGLITL